MQTAISCRMCEKLALTLELTAAGGSPITVPNTFDEKSGQYGWKFHEFFAYALIPRKVQGSQAEIDLYLCIDEDDLDDIDVCGYARRFLRERIYPQWNNIKRFDVHEPVLEAPEDIECRLLRHHLKLHLS